MKRILKIVLGLFLVNIRSVLAHNDETYGYGMMHMMWPGTGHYYYGFGIFGLLFMIVFWGAVIYFIYWLIKRGTEGKKESPLELLKKRYAKGEINKKQFEKMKKELK